MTTLSELSRPGQKALIRDVEGDDAIAMRLMEMGLVDGAMIEFLGLAPLGDPAEYLIRGYRLSLRKAEASRVVIELT